MSKPYFEPDGSLVVPFDASANFHWWNGGNSIQSIIKRLILFEKENYEAAQRLLDRSKTLLEGRHKF